MYKKMKAQHTETGSDPKSIKTEGLGCNLTMTRYGQSGAIQSHVSDPAPGRRAPNISQALNVARYNVRTLADTNRETDRGIRQFNPAIKLQQIINIIKNIDSP